MMMLKKLRFFLLISFVAAIAACTKVDLNFGAEIIDNGNTQIAKADTFGVTMSTVYLDSFPTSARGVTLVGGYTDTAFGRIDTKCFFEVAPPSNSSSSDFQNTYFDSLTLILKLNKTYYGDTTKPVHVDAYQLNQLITPPNNGTYLYNNEQFSVASSPLGSKDLLISPRSSVDTVVIRLSDALGKQLLSKLQNPTDFDMKNSTNFINGFFNGIRLSSNSNSATIYGFTDSIKMRLSYRKQNMTVQQTHTDFVMTNKNHHFNNITVNRAGTVLNGINIAREIPSSKTYNAAFTQPASGVMMKLRFLTLRGLLSVPNFVKVLKANLIVRPLVSSYDYKMTLPPQLRLSTTNYLNQVGSDLIVSTGTSAVTQTGNLQLDYNTGNTYYSYDLSNYIKVIINDVNYVNSLEGLLLTPPSPAFETQFGRLIAGDKNNVFANNQIQLQVYYATVQ
jgi:hypothetical protein